MTSSRTSFLALCVAVAAAACSLAACGASQVQTETGTPATQRYVLIRDASAPTGDDVVDIGADIDAVVLRKADGQLFFAEAIELFEAGPGSSTMPQTNPSDALEQPDAFADWESDTPRCEITSGSTSLGGPGGMLLVRMPVDIEPGDTLVVLEVGGCTGNEEGAYGIPDAIEVAVGASTSPDGAWTPVASGSGPVVRAQVP